jgi:hypothetical protein
MLLTPPTDHFADQTDACGENKLFRNASGIPLDGTS